MALSWCSTVPWFMHELQWLSGVAWFTSSSSRSMTIIIVTGMLPTFTRSASPAQLVTHSELYRRRVSKFECVEEERRGVNVYFPSRRWRRAGGPAERMLSSCLTVHCNVKAKSGARCKSIPPRSFIKNRVFNFMEHYYYCKIYWRST